MHFIATGIKLSKIKQSDLQDYGNGRKRTADDD